MYIYVYTCTYIIIEFNLLSLLISWLRWWLECCCARSLIPGPSTRWIYPSPCPQWVQGFVSSRKTRAHFPKESTNKFGGLHRLQVPWRWWWLCQHRWWGGRKRLLGGRKRLFDPLRSTEVAMFQRFTTAVEKEYLLLCHWKGRLKSSHVLERII